MKIYHNPRCRKSRETLNLLKEKGVNADVILYLEQPLSKKELKETLNKLRISAVDLLRKGEKIFKEEYKGKSLTEDQWIDAMIKHPKLMERPIVIDGKRAVIGRPPEKVLELL